MKKNMGNLDRILRVIVAIVIGFLYFNGTIEGMVGNTLLLLAGVFLMTSAISFCPLYLPFGVNTSSKEK